MGLRPAAEFEELRNWDLRPRVVCVFATFYGSSMGTPAAVHFYVAQ